jgi:menaquinone-9 beta-reductase
MKKRIAIIGGGIAGLALSIDLRQKGFEVVILEKGTYPRHKVCGEYISMESRKYLEKICPALKKLDLPVITHFKLSSPANLTYQTPLDMGGFGISRYLLELMLYNRALEVGATVQLNCKATEFNFDSTNQRYIITTNHGEIHADLVCNASGRKSNLEAKNRIKEQKGNNYVGVKYHIKIPRDRTLIEIHNFAGGYCGISSIENDLACLCYIVNSKMLKNTGNSIPLLEERVLHKNVHLKKIFTEAEFINKEPITISGINFMVKQPASGDAVFLGDAAGSIAPITGNGMSMAIRAASVLAAYVQQYFDSSWSKQQFMTGYSAYWKNEFSTRISLSRYFQKLSEFPLLTSITIRLLKAFPPLAQQIIRSTHGQPF